jgi:hypothetical protein
MHMHMQHAPPPQTKHAHTKHPPTHPHTHTHTRARAQVVFAPVNSAMLAQRVPAAVKALKYSQWAVDVVAQAAGVHDNSTARVSGACAGARAACARVCCGGGRVLRVASRGDGSCPLPAEGTLPPDQQPRL